MRTVQNAYLFAVTPPAAIVDNASLTCNVIDGGGYDYCRIFAYYGATDVATVALKVQESDTKSNTTTLTGGADVTGCVYGTSTNIAGSTSALPTSTADNKFYVFDIDMRGRKRYLLPVVTCGDGTTGTYICLWAELYNADLVPATAAECNAGDILRV